MKVFSFLSAFWMKAGKPVEFISLFKRKNIHIYQEPSEVKVFSEIKELLIKASKETKVGEKEQLILRANTLCMKLIISFEGKGHFIKAREFQEQFSNYKKSILIKSHSKKIKPLLPKK